MTDEEIFDVAILGAGPCGLAVASRLCEHTPSALFTDDEHQRFHWIRKHGSKVSIKERKNGKEHRSKQSGGPRRLSTVVLDATADEWMMRWNTLFKTFDIQHLRSPMFWHVDPADRDALLSYTHDRGSKGDLIEIAGCVGKEVSKHHKKKRINGKRPTNEANINEREKEDYFTPSQRIFQEHCQCVVDRYKLREGLVKKESVQDIRYDESHDAAVNGPLFTIVTDKGSRLARTVVLAVGPANAPVIPQELSTVSSKRAGGSVGQVHSMHIKEFPDASVQRKMQQRIATNVVVVGGGLTSAQISDLALRRGVTRVWHLMRGPCTLKAFDVDITWMGKWRNLEQAAFWLADTDEERLSLIKKARGGGSITPRFYKILEKHIAAKTLSIHTHTTIASKTYDLKTSQWTIITDPPIPDLPPIDYIYYATGVQTNFETLPYLQSLLKSHPIHGHGGLPCLTNDLSWRDDVPLFVTGRLASLRLGPAGGNLGGARIGAERIAWSIMDYLQNDSDKIEHFEDNAQEKLDFAAARGNRYNRLVVE